MVRFALLIVSFSVIYFFKYGFANKSNIVLNIPQGKLMGAWNRSLNGHLYASFQGIPFAKPPVASRRFKAPEKPGRWFGTWNAKRLSSACLQYYQNQDNDDDQTSILGDEDCLYLNVYTSNPKPTANLPVIVFIHGGGFTFGSGISFLPDFLLDRNVILVTVNYRLGPLGFLSTEDDVVPGNNGLKDQVMALQWIHDNIKHFGGNPDSVTITGMSAGGVSVNYHMLSPLSAGLFHRGISQSGTVLCCWALQENALQKAKLVGESLGCPTSLTKELINCLRDRPAKAIVRIMSVLNGWVHSPVAPYGPVIEPANIEGAFITEHPYTIIKSGRGRDMPWIASITTHEGLYPGAIFLQKDNILVDLEERWEEIAPLIFDFHDTVPLTAQAEVSRKIKQFYTNGEPITKETYGQLINAIGDRLFKLDIEKTMKLESSVGKKSIYFYEFGYAGNGSLGIYLSHSNEFLGVSHGDDTGYALKTVYMDPTTTSDDRAMIDLMVKMFVSFATTGVPNVGDVTWKPLKTGSDEIDYLEILSPHSISMKKTSDLTKTNGFWSTLGIKENDAIDRTFIKYEL